MLFQNGELRGYKMEDNVSYVKSKKYFAPVVSILLNQDAMSFYHSICRSF